MDVMHRQSVISEHGGPKQCYFSPYSDNGGSIVAIAGEDFVVIASDSRLSAGYSIYTRDQSKLFKLSDKCILGSGGCWCDILTFTRFLEARMKMYLHEHHKPMSTPAVAQLIVTMLYHKRFFPYYISNILAGLDEEGKGCIYSYDPVGHCERVQYRSGGSGSALLQPLLDSQASASWARHSQCFVPVNIVLRLLHTFAFERARGRRYNERTRWFHMFDSYSYIAVVSL
ncbi:unnamed protein product [Ixodes pacificus]